MNSHQHTCTHMHAMHTHSRFTRITHTCTHSRFTHTAADSHTHAHTADTHTTDSWSIEELVKLNRSRNTVV